MADKIDPKNPPAGAKTVKSPGGPEVIVVNGKVYGSSDGVRLLPGAEALILNATNNGTRDAGQMPNPITDVSNFISFITNENVWIRAGLIALGTALAIIGVSMLISGTKTASLATSLAADTIPGGKLIKKVI